MGALKKGRSSIITDFMRDDKPISSKMIKSALEHQDELVTQTYLKLLIICLTVLLLL